MATSSTYFGLRRGSTKSHTFSVVDGKQITKDRVEGSKNPRTLSQMTQRCLFSTVGAAYSTTKCICDHSFEGKTAGMACMREFMSTNLKQIQLSKEYDDGSFGYNNYKESTFKAGSYIISKGSLPAALMSAEIESVSVANKKVSLSLVLTTNGTIAEVADAMGCKNFGDMCTVAVICPKALGGYGFGAVRFTYKSGNTVLESFSVAVTGDIAGATPTFTDNTLMVEVRMAYNLAEDATADNTYMTAITSRKVNGSWLRSTAQFDVTDATPTFAAAISTYPVGQERFLNGSDVDIQTSSVSQSDNSTSQTTTVEAPTISGETPFAESTQVTMSGPAGAEIRYTTDGSTPTAESTLYSGAVTLSASATVKAIAIKDGTSSEVASKEFTKNGIEDEPIPGGGS